MGFRLRSWDFTTKELHFDFGVQDGVNRGGSFAYGAVPVTNSWYHVFGTYDDIFIKIYVNGALVGQAPWNGPLAVNNDEPIWVGRDSTNEGRTDGRIYEVAIYARALSADEIKEIYEASKPEGRFTVRVRGSHQRVVRTAEVWVQVVE